MRIALDARTLYRPDPRGIGKGQIELYRALSALRPDWHVMAYHRNPDAAIDLLPAGVTPRRIDMRGDRFDAWQRWRLPAAAWRDGADLLHCPANTSPAWAPLPLIVTIHDTIPLDRPRDYPAAHCRRFESHIRRAIARAAAIVCPSRFTARRLIDGLRADARRVHVIPQAAGGDMRPLDGAAIQIVAQRYGLNGPYALHLGAAAPRKNTARVIEAWARLSTAQRDGHMLLIVGLDDAMLAQCSEHAAALGANHTIRLHGYAPQADLPALLGGATCLVYPSLAEGFGLPMLDAFATDTPVLTSNVASLPEVAGDAALLVDPHDADAIAAGLVEVLTSPARRAALIEAGRVRGTQFTWSAAASAVASCFESVIQAANSRTPRRAA